ncbi:hypothetical protein TFUB22_02555 [Tannerella forsythia]|nr:hypothetical protein TFUB22_02555 [Tannerella forsythia]
MRHVKIYRTVVVFKQITTYPLKWVIVNSLLLILQRY